MRSLVTRLINDQRTRFLAVGATNTAVGYLLFVAFDRWLFSAIPFGYLLSLVLSYAIALILAFFLYRKFVFKVKGRVFGDLVRFIGVYLVAIGINAVALPLLVEFAGLPPFVAQAIILVVTTVLSFFGHKKVSFHRQPQAAEPAAAEQGS
jgi:putative flippase GtrA